MQARSPEVLQKFTSTLIDNSPTISNFDKELKAEFNDRWLEIMNIFNENHRYLSILIKASFPLFLQILLYLYYLLV
ncbi:hypothetical protein GCM10007425_00440 [Lysinibacillus alkalisoli]|uniref:Uncharacterized protein n=1 Tax=Lysinibacillus alkalisoli TaxID=1911548 RepID=A0A917FX01_9BACI|nr:hypothetical protein GCM10007425_00440 [Lysinibacillus alkalisoli]